MVKIQSILDLEAKLYVVWGFIHNTDSECDVSREIMHKIIFQV